MRKRFALGVVVAVLLGFGPGCGGRATDAPKTVPVTGTVTFKGQPLEGATVAFSPKTTGLRSAIGTTDAAGHFKLTTLYPADGAMPGSYTVAISKTEGGAAPAPNVDTSVEATIERSKKAAMEGKMGPGVRKGASKDLLPAKYKTANTSGLTAEVKAQGGNDVTFDLTE